MTRRRGASCGLERIRSCVSEIPPVEITAIDHMRESWWEIQRQFELARKLLESSAYDDLLGAVGCSGYQLRTKIATFEQARDTYARVKVSEPRVRERGGGFFSWLRRSFLKPVLKGANALLGSVAKVLPPAEIIKAFKESGEAIAEVSDALKEAHDEGVL